MEINFDELNYELKNITYNTVSRTNEIAKMSNSDNGLLFKLYIVKYDTMRQ